MTDFLKDGPADAPVTVLLAHGAGAPMDSPSMQAITQALAAEGLTVARFEFAYMAGRRQGVKKPPPRAETVMDEYREAVAGLGASGPLVIGGKSMGGRVASMVADDLGVAGLLCLGYPFHPPGKPGQLRTKHLKDLKTPALIVQGTRDPFGTVDEVPGYDLSGAIEVFWVEDGEHDLKPRKKVTGKSQADALAEVAAKVRDWAAALR
ncbi:alpha/beta hydrolase family protein [Wenxinia marina]|uniref:Putative hydrolase of the alpha/beta-hydrolase fold protein n=1 Tax=Wenxinia marina DSM 24838 TaxID=1123501 RepID=A0A0D0PF89_9RHOB|nr:alpha/beta family hydrolase [Wenxinia marina]KIQ70031.1 putative hydrolase of the alpha/beta-hydrolase fold protein [Wenxinia marina DSM 24838]GGL62975.1 hydrolase [Wenxinia marina]